MFIVLVLLFIVIAIVIGLGIRIVPQGMTMVIERLGKYRRTLDSGVNVIIPFFDRPRTVVWDMPAETEAGKRRRATQWSHPPLPKGRGLHKA